MKLALSPYDIQMHIRINSSNYLQPNPLTGVRPLDERAWVVIMERLCPERDIRMLIFQITEFRNGWQDIPTV